MQLSQENVAVSKDSVAVTSESMAVAKNCITMVKKSMEKGREIPRQLMDAILRQNVLLKTCFC